MTSSRFFVAKGGFSTGPAGGSFVLIQVRCPCLRKSYAGERDILRTFNVNDSRQHRRNNGSRRGTRAVGRAAGAIWPKEQLVREGIVKPFTFYIQLFFNVFNKEMVRFDAAAPRFLVATVRECKGAVVAVDVLAFNLVRPTAPQPTVKHVHNPRARIRIVLGNISTCYAES